MGDKGEEFDLEHVRELMRAMSELDIHELQLTLAKDREIVLKRHPPAPLPPPPPPAPNITVAAPTMSAAPAMMSAPPPMGSIAPAESVPPPAAAPAGDFVTSPFVGTFYRAPSPGASPFVQVGDKFKAGDILCIVEAMKLMNEIEAEFDGEILEIVAENGKPVEYGQSVFRVAKH